MKDTILILILLTDLRLLASSRISATVRWVAIQGVLLGAFAFLAQQGKPTLEFTAVVIAATLLKGIVFPSLLSRSMRSVETRGEVKPYVSYLGSMYLGLTVLIGAIWLGKSMAASVPMVSPLTLSTSFFSAFTGLFLTVTRRKAILQVAGYLVLDNAIYALGVGAFSQTSFLIEIAVLLDLFVAIFVMGTMIDYIYRAFNHIDASRLRSLKG